MKQTPNSRRLNERAREVIASLVIDEIADPRVDLVTITGAEVSPDRSIVAVYVSTDPERYSTAIAGLESAKGRLRSLLGHALGWRVSPELRFFIDESVDTGMRINEALKDVPPSLVGREDEADEALPGEQGV
ncbi:MAG: 30S ribosome-binding factor RbfA [Coriobacteriia bacterium]|nr:30S ribosome-binding factor RbfA [Coriobacteriia bacterium]